MKENLLNFTLPLFQEKLISCGIEKYRGKQLFEWIYKKNTFDINLIPNISKDLKKKLHQYFELNLLKIDNIANNKEDNSYKFLLKTYDNNLIESILMLTGDRATICVSCMIGCPLKCKFCATGSALKFIRKLDTSEIISQILTIQKYAHDQNICNKITNIVFMGMGEPLLNLQNLEKSIQILLDENAFGLSKNRITLSTAGITTGLANFINKYQIKLAVSLHFPTDEQRSEFMPINKTFCLTTLINELKKINLGKRDYITIEYLMLQNINDTLNHAKKLIQILHNLKVKINLIPYNPTETLKESPSTENQINLFAKYLRSKGIMVTVRRSRGKDIKGGCGQFVLSKPSHKAT